MDNRGSTQIEADVFKYKAIYTKVSNSPSLRKALRNSGIFEKRRNSLMFYVSFNNTRQSGGMWARGIRTDSLQACMQASSPSLPSCPFSLPPP